MYDRLTPSRRGRPISPPNSGRCQRLLFFLPTVHLTPRVLITVIVMTTALLVATVTYHINMVQAKPSVWVTQQRIAANYCGRFRCKEHHVVHYQFDLLQTQSVMAPKGPEALNSIAVSTSMPQARQASPLAGPLCVFVPTTATQDQKKDLIHRNETLAFLESWADNSTVLFSDSNDHLAHGMGSSETVRALANLAVWTEWHTGVVLERPSLRRRGSTVESLKGRGQLSIPLFHWISQLVKRNDPLVQNCKWFMKCDTDTYLRRGLLERDVLNKLDHTKPYHVGVPLTFNTHPYHHTARSIVFDYNIGGPGYSFSRGLMASVDAVECVKSMGLDPVLLIHDDVATGYCATYHAPRSERLDVTGYVAASAHRVVSYLLSPIPPANATSNVSQTRQPLSTSPPTPAPTETQWQPRNFSARHRGRFIRRDFSRLEATMNQRFTFSPPESIRNDTDCISYVFALHPVTADITRLLAQRDRERPLVVPLGAGDTCTVKLMSGQPIMVGSGWTLNDTMELMTKFWVKLWDRRRYQSYYGQSFRYAGEALDVLMKG